MPSRSRVFAGSADLTSRFFPASQPDLYFLQGGEYLGPQLYTNKTARINLQGLVAERKMRSGNVGIAAEIWHGKGVLAKSCAVQFSGMKAGVIDADQEEFVRTRIQVNDHKLEAGKGEWGMVTRFKLREPIYLAELGRITPFDLRMGMSDIQQMELLNILLEDANGGPIDSAESYAAQIVMHQVIRDRVNPELSWIGVRSRNITLQDEEVYVAHFNNDIRALYAEELEHNDEFRQRFNEVLGRDDPSNEGNRHQREQQFQRVKAAGSRVSDLINVILNSGVYGQVFGGTNSMYDLLTDTYVHFDWVNLPPRAAGLLEAVMKFWQMVAARKEGGAELTVPHYVFHDEQGSELTKSLARAVIRAEEARKARAVQTINFGMYQNFDDLLKIGEPGSSFRGQGEVMHRAISAWFIGRQAYDDDNLHAMTRRGATDKEAYMTTILPMGTWGFLVPGSDRPMEFFHHILLPTIAPLVDSTSAARTAAER